jgi:hypothetical protein
VLAVAFEAADYNPEHPVLVSRAAFLHDMLHDVIAVLIGNHAGLHAFVKLGQDYRLCLEVLWSFQATLYDPTTIRVQTEMLDLSQEGRIDESDRVRVATLDGLLDNVVAVLVLDALHDVVLQLTHQGGLLFDQDVLQSLLGARVTKIDRGKKEDDR